jgi:hypothetical protein
MDKKDIFLLNLTLHFVSDNGWEYEVRRRHAGPESDKKFYLWTIDDDLLCPVPSFVINENRVDFTKLYNFVMGACKTYEEENGRA